MKDTAESLLNEANEFNASLKVLVEDNRWTIGRMKALEDKLDARGIVSEAQREEYLTEFRQLMQRAEINKGVKTKLDTQEKDLGIRINAFFKKKVW